MIYAGTNSSPYRLPCPGGKTKRVHGSCYQHKKESEKAVPFFVNITQVGEAYPATGNPGPPDPCPEGSDVSRSPDRAADGNCFRATPRHTVVDEEHNLYLISTGDRVTLNYPYVDLASIVVKSGDGSTTYEFGELASGGSPGHGDWMVSESGTGDPNTYLVRLPTASESLHDGDLVKISYRTGVVDMSTCHKTGWKAVRAVKFWHGRRAFDFCGCADDDGVKYLQMASEFSVSGEANQSNINSANPALNNYGKSTVSGGITITGSVSRVTGKRSQSGCWDNGCWSSQSYSASVDGENVDPETGEMVLDGNGDPIWGDPTPGGWYNIEGEDDHGVPFASTFAANLTPPTDICVQESACTVFTPGWSNLVGDPNMPDKLQADDCATQDEIDEIQPYEYTYYGAGEGDDQYKRIYRGLVTLSDSTTVAGTMATRTISFHAEISLVSGTNNAHNTFTHVSTLSCTWRWTLSGQNTLAQLGSDCVALLKRWDLANDKQIDWRQDGMCLRVPVVRYNEVQTPVMPGLGNCDFEDTSDANDDVLGEPNPIGYGFGEVTPKGHYSFRELLYNEHGVVTGMGESQPDFVPLAATYWTHLHEEISDPDYGVGPTYPGGAFIMVSEDKLVMQKFAIIKDIAPSLNFYRPCGPDRLLTNGDDKDPVILYPDAWPICGRVKVNMAATWVSEGSNYTNIQLDEPAPGIQDGDQLDFLNYDEEGNEIDIVTRTVLYRDSDTQIKLTGASDPNRQWVKSHASPAYYWHDNQPKGDYTFQQWSTNTCQDGCLPRNICHPSVICISPNAAEPEDWDSEEAYVPVDVFPHGHTYPMPSPQANTLWHGLPVPDIADPIWSGPGTPRAESRCARPTGAPEANCNLCMTLPCPNVSDGVCPAIPCGSCQPGDIWI